MSFVPFFFHLSCPFKIRYFNLGVFPATIDWNRELAGCRGGKAYPRALHIPGHTGDSFLFLFFFKWRLLNQQCSHSLTACLWRPSSCSPVKPFMIYRDDMNVSRSRSALPIEKLDFQVSGGESSAARIWMNFSWFPEVPGPWRDWGCLSGEGGSLWEWHAAVKTGNNMD